MNAMTKSNPCSCGSNGGSNGGSGGGCGCGGNCTGGGDCGCGGICGNECAVGPLQRPLFFAGQLLTEDDLQLLSDYAATKARLHNRFLHGAGVVCGLLVGCHPCGDGKVIVHSGAALDCCGNDIYVPCSVELDINKMVADLRIKMRGGHDCGDPCEAECDDSPDDVKCLDRKGRRYCLYIEYCEELEEPVTPYVSNGNCAVQVCKPTRIHEGYKFELRCPTEEHEPDNISTRIRACIGDLTSADKSASDALATEAYSRRYRQAAPLAKAGRIVEFTDADHSQLKSAPQALSGLRAAAQDGVPGVAGTDEPITESLVRRMLDQYQSTASAIIRYDLQSEETKKALEGTMRGLGHDVEAARSMIQSGGPRLRTLSAAHMGSARDRIVAETWIGQGMQWTDPKLAEEQKASEPQLLYAYNAPTSAAQSKQFVRDLEQLRDWLVDRLDHKPLFSDCRLRCDVLAIELPDNNGRNDPKLVVDATIKLVEVFLRYLVDCICAALNPPCQPCHDDAVKLACLTVEDCDVVRICNLERTFVLSAPAMRYWLPFLHTIGELLERACCEFDIRLSKPRGTVNVDRNPPAVAVFGRKQSYMATTAPAYRHVDEQPQLAALMQIANIDQRQLSAAINFMGDVGGLALATRDFPAGGFDRDLLGFGRQAKTSLIDTVVKEPELQESLVKSFEKHFADTEVASDKVAKELQAALRDQKRRNDSLERRLAKLESGRPS